MTRNCEHCHAESGAYGAWDIYGDWHLFDDIECMNSDVGFHLFDGDYPELAQPRIEVAERSDGRLSALCQSCWRRLDPAAVQRRQADERIRQRIEAGQTTLFPMEVR